MHLTHLAMKIKHRNKTKQDLRDIEEALFTFQAEESVRVLFYPQYHEVVFSLSWCRERIKTHVALVLHSYISLPWLYVVFEGTWCNLVSTSISLNWQYAVNVLESRLRSLDSNIMTVTPRHVHGAVMHMQILCAMAQQ